jgi:hypothetical protein
MLLPKFHASGALTHDSRSATYFLFQEEEHEHTLSLWIGKVSPVIITSMIKSCI